MGIVQELGQAQIAATTDGARSKEMGKDDFLKMFLAQVKNQDPLNPMQNQEMASQLAQFSSLEQLFNVNENLQGLMSSQDEASRLQALDYIGKEVVATGDALQIEEGKSAAGRFQLEERADCTVAVLDEAGYVVRTLSLGSFGPGSHSFQWDGRDGAGNPVSPGIYRFSVLAKSATGETVSADRRMSGVVTGVNLADGKISLYIGGVPVPASAVTEVLTPAAVQ